MSFRAVFRNGKVEFQPGVQIPEGAELVVSVIDEADVPTLGELFKDVAGKAAGKPADGSLQHDHYIYGTPKR